MDNKVFKTMKILVHNTNAIISPADNTGNTKQLSMPTQWF